MNRIAAARRVYGSLGMSLFALIATLSAQAQIVQEEIIRRATAEPSRNTGIQLPGDDKRLVFKFADMTGKLKPSGEWSIDGVVTHTGLLCANYQVGLRFGIGAPGCQDVNWISRERYATNQKQCNNAQVQHAGIEYSDEIAPDFDKITCAERVIRCFGNCK